LDTNVLISGIFFGGPPGWILDHWAEGEFELLVTPCAFRPSRPPIPEESGHTVRRNPASRSGTIAATPVGAKATLVGSGYGIGV
jgi:hypothetical protein